MSKRYIQYGKIVLSIIASYILTMFLMQTVFQNPLHPQVDHEKIAAGTAKMIDRINIFKPQNTSISTATGFFARFRLQPAQIQQPTVIPTTPPPQVIVVPTTPLIQPSATPIVFFVTNTPVPIIIPPTNIPSPTRIPPTNTPVPITYNCPTTSSESYTSISASQKTDRPAESHPDLNLHIRGYANVSEEKKLIDLAGDTDNRAPQLSSLIAGSNSPEIISTYRVYDWNWSNNTRGGFVPDWDVTLIGLKASPGQEIKVPSADYDIGGAQAMVLYAEQNQLTIKYTREDNVVSGYTIHVDDICVDPNLLAKYNSLNANGRGSLPALTKGKKIGTAKTAEVKVAIRDTGLFMDPRSRKDWWSH